MKLKRSILVTLALLVALATVGCSAPAGPAGSAGSRSRDASTSSENEAPGEAKEGTSTLIDPSGNVVLFIDNGSIPGDTVDIRIQIDGQTVFDADVPSARDSSITPDPRQPYLVLRLSRGRHVLKAESQKGAASLRKTFDVTDQLWIGLAYTYNTSRYGTPSPRSFNIVVSEREMGRV